MSDNFIKPPTPSVPLPRSTLIFLPEWGYREAALHWFERGLKVIPVAPGTKITAVKWGPWLDGLSPQKIVEHWIEHPDHELGFIVGDDMIVIDADSPESIAAILEIETRYGISPSLVVKTNKGEHHHFRRVAGTHAKSDSHSTEKHPGRLDIKTGRALVILPPSTGKSIITDTAVNKDDLSEATQEFIDAIFQHNGRSAPSVSLEVAPRTCIRVEADDIVLQKLEALLGSIDPDSGYEYWLHAGMAIFHETSGSDEGLELFDTWSSKGKKYKGSKDLETKWRSFRDDVETPVTIGTLIKMASENGADVAAILRCNDDEFDICEFEVVDQPQVLSEKSIVNPLIKFSLLGMSGEIMKQIVEQKYVLGEIALQGQATVIYAAPNTGKTLIILSLLIQSISLGRVDPAKVYYINVDDTANGLVEKLRVAEEYGFHMLAEGYREFKASEFVLNIKEMNSTDTASGAIIILDTLKKFTNLMDKNVSSRFTTIIRSFIMKGGTVIALAHTNKNPGRNGKRVHAGTSDIVDDFDCAYIVDTISQDQNKKVVEFENQKKRGNVPMSVSFSYDAERGITYNELLLSVQEVDNLQLEPMKQAAEEKSDAEVIVAIQACIKEDVNSKMKLAAAAARSAKVSNKSALKIIEKYTGVDPAIHLWSFAVRERGAKVYELLKRPSGSLPGPTLIDP